MLKAATLVPCAGGAGGSERGVETLSAVSRTAILTLRARADEHARVDRVFEDPFAAEWYARLSWPFELDTWYSPRSQWALAFRADDIDNIVRRYTASSAPTSIVELGCGLSTRSHRLDDLSFMRWVDLDLPEIIELRRALGAGEHRPLRAGEPIASSVLDTGWMDRLEGGPASHLFIAEGLFYYLPRASVDALIRELRRHFSGSAIILDVLGANDYPTLLRNTQAVGTPVLWKIEGDYASCLSDFGLGLVEGFEPDRLMGDALRRYWHRFDSKTRGGIYWVMHSEAVRRGRSGTVLGRLDPLDESAFAG